MPSAPIADGEQGTVVSVHSLYQRVKAETEGTQYLLRRVGCDSPNNTKGEDANRGGFGANEHDSVFHRSELGSVSHVCSPRGRDAASSGISFTQVKH